MWIFNLSLNIKIIERKLKEKTIIYLYKKNKQLIIDY